MTMSSSSDAKGPLAQVACALLAGLHARGCQIGLARHSTCVRIPDGPVRRSVASGRPCVCTHKLVNARPMEAWERTICRVAGGRGMQRQNGKRIADRKYSGDTCIQTSTLGCRATRTARDSLLALYDWFCPLTVATGHLCVNRCRRCTAGRHGWSPVSSNGACGSYELHGSGRKESHEARADDQIQRNSFADMRPSARAASFGLGPLAWAAPRLQEVTRLVTGNPLACNSVHVTASTAHQNAERSDGRKHQHSTDVLIFTRTLVLSSSSSPPQLAVACERGHHAHYSAWRAPTATASLQRHRAPWSNRNPAAASFHMARGSPG